MDFVMDPTIVIIADGITCVEYEIIIYSHFEAKAWNLN